MKTLKQYDLSNTNLYCTPHTPPTPAIKKEVLVRELHLLGEELRKRDAELRVFAEQLDDTGGDLKAERERQVQ